MEFDGEEEEIDTRDYGQVRDSYNHLSELEGDEAAKREFFGTIYPKQRDAVSRAMRMIEERERVKMKMPKKLTPAVIQ